MTLAEIFMEKGKKEGIKKGLEKGLEKGRKRGKIEVTKRLLKKGLSLEEVVELVDLPPEEIEKAVRE